MIAHVDNRITYNGNGNATEFAYQFKILDRTDIKVLLTDADGKEKLLTKDYYVDVEKNVVRYPGYAVGAEVPESEMMYKATNNFTLDLGALAMKVDKSQISVFSAYFTADADYALTITNCGTVKYIGSASDVAITSSGLLLNIMMVKDASNNLTSIVQANKLS